VGKVVENERIGQKLLKGWRKVRLGDVCDINPPRPRTLGRNDDAPTSFVPMPAVDARLGQITKPEVRPFAEVRGYLETLLEH
jgi:type I restriction enzyme, S subunit